MRMRESHRNQVGASDGWTRSPGSSCFFLRSSDTNIPGCSDVRRPLCDVQRIGQRLSPIVGQTTWNITLAPTRTNYFQIWEFLNHVTDTTDPDVNHRLSIQDVNINRIVQEPFAGAPGLANNSEVLTDDYETPPAGSGTSPVGATPVAWGIISQTALIYVLTIGGVSRQPAEVSADYYAAAFGNGLDACPPGVDLGCPFHMKTGG